MRVLIDTTYSRRAPRSGTAVYIERLCAALAQSGEVDLVEVANRRRRSPAGGGAGSARNLITDLWWTLVELPRLARRTGAQLIHHPLPARALVSPVPQVVTVVDLAFERLPDRFDRAFRIYAHQTHRAAARAASAVICISNTTAADARELWGVAAERIRVAHLGPGQELPHDRSGGPQAGGPYFLYVGDEEPRKNLGLLLEAHALHRARSPSPLELVLAGRGLTDRRGVRIVRDPDPRSLALLYRRATALVHPSLYEGFGLTPLEAMSLGTPVIAARSPGVVEVCGSAVRYADPRDPQSLAAALDELAGSALVREELARRGAARAAEFSWSRCARAHLAAYSLALGA
jgi:glycosyltransferase involved in cell wall biosynthesis